MNAPVELAGKSGRCPKCSAPFVVPRDEDVELAPSAVDDLLPPVLPAMGSGKGNLAGGEVFVFLCPNGHKLHGPPSLKGKAGQCPHCGARFRIPSDEDMEPAEGQADQVDDQAVRWEGLNQTEGGSLRTPPLGPSGLGYIVGQLWDWRTDDTELEVFLSEGEILAPDFYSEFLSTSDYGVFASQESDGSYAITVVPWSQVRRVGMRRLTDLSPDHFQ